MPQAIALQSGKDSVHVTFAPESGYVHLKTVDAHGFTVRRDVIEIAQHPEMECLHGANGWYMPLLNKVLAKYEKNNQVRKAHQRRFARRNIRKVPVFIAKHYGQTHG